MFKKIAIGVVVVIAAILLYATTRPDTFQVERMVSIKAPPDKIYPLLADFHRWDSWSPWEKLDPAMKRTFAGAPSGKGAVYAWNGSGKVGSGRMEILDTTVPTKLDIKLDFTEPIASSDSTVFTLTPKGDMTDVSWVMSGPSPYLSKLLGLAVSMDQMIGKDFDTGLANLKRVAEQ